MGVPGRVLSVSRSGGVPVAEVDFEGTVREVNLIFVPDAEAGDYLLVHSGLAVNRMSRAEVDQIRRLLG